MIFSWSGTVLTPLCPASNKRHRALHSHAYFLALWPCQPRFWSVTKQREMFTTSRAISKHTSSPTLRLPRPCLLSHCLLHKPSRLGSGHPQGPLFTKRLPFSSGRCAVDCLLRSRLALSLETLKAQGKSGQWAGQIYDVEDHSPS